MLPSESHLELITIGRASVDLYGEQIGGRLEDMASFAKYVGGSPTNTAIGGARLGLRCALLTRVGADHMGRYIREQLSREGVDVRGVISDPQRLTALVLLGIRDRCTFPLLFYRENCADMALCADDVELSWVAGAGAVLLNGTHLSQPAPNSACMAAAREAKRVGARVIFDIDYRPVLWGLAPRDRGEDRYVEDLGATQALQRVLPLCDLVVGTEEEIRILGGSHDTLGALREIRNSTSAVLVCKLGAEGCAAFPGPIPPRLADGVRAAGFPVEVFNVLGAGDAFMAGFLRGWLRGESIECACLWGNACGAIVVSRHGCAPAMPTWAELQSFLQSSARPHRLREDAELEHLHWASTRSRLPSELIVLAVDDVASLHPPRPRCGGAGERWGEFALLALQALHRAARGAPHYGIALDGRLGEEALAQAAEMPYWVGRRIDVPNSQTLTFDSSAAVATEVRSWPIGQVVTCRVQVFAEHKPGQNERQERELLRLFDACRKTGHELLLQVHEEDAAGRSVPATLERLYALGIRPDWWELAPCAEADGWRRIEAAVQAGDPYCRGVLISFLDAAEPKCSDFQAAARCSLIKGFAIGRGIFHDALLGWMEDRINASQLLAAISAKLERAAQLWREAHAVAQMERS